MMRVRNKGKGNVKEIVNALKKEGIDAEVCTRLVSAKEQVQS